MAMYTFIAIIALLLAYSAIGRDLSEETIWTFCLGAATSFIVIPVARLLFAVICEANNVDKKPGGRSQPYGLHHAVLNIELPPKSMWMNLGFWKDSPSTLSEACSLLLQELLLEAGLASNEPNGAVLRYDINVIDVGFGCGDQTLQLCRSQRPRVGVGVSGIHLNGESNPQLQSERGRLRYYVGITMDTQQYHFARERLTNFGLLGQEQHGSAGNQPDIRVFCADAANPASWRPELGEAVMSAVQKASSTGAQVWLLGLDSLYHLYPTREQIFACAQQSWGASVLAFDLMVSSECHFGLLDKLLLRLFCSATGTPYKNLITVQTYRQQLEAAGYRDVHFRDISEHVFRPLVQYLTQQDARLRNIGAGLGKYTAAKWVFERWARTGYVRGFIVVARHPGTGRMSLPPERRQD